MDLRAVLRFAESRGFGWFIMCGEGRRMREGERGLLYGQERA